MAQQYIVLNMTGQAALNVLNSNFTELYSNLPQVLKLPGVSVNTAQAINADTMVTLIAMSGTAGAPIVRIGLTPNGTEILPDTAIGNSQPDIVTQYFPAAGTLYFTVSGGTISIRIEFTPNYYS